MSEELTVIIPTWNGLNLLRHCLSALSRQTRPAHILVVDNGSSDGTAEFLGREYPEVKCLPQPENLGFAGAVNRGIETCETAYLALLNNDTEVEPDWVEQGLKAFARHPDFDFFASRMLNFHCRHRLDSAGDCYDRFGMPYKRGYGELSDHFLEKESVLGASAGAAFYRRSLFDRVGLFEERFYLYLEDVELSLRSQLLGHRCLYLPGARVYHMEAASDHEREKGVGVSDDRQRGVLRPVYTSNRVYWITRNRWLLMWLYQPLRHFPHLVWGWGRSFAFHFWKAGFRWAFLRGLWAGLAATPWAMGRRWQLRRIQKISDQDLCTLLRKC